MYYDKWQVTQNSRVTHPNSPFKSSFKAALATATSKHLSLKNYVFNVQLFGKFRCFLLSLSHSKLWHWYTSLFQQCVADVLVDIQVALRLLRPWRRCLSSQQLQKIKSGVSDTLKTVITVQPGKCLVVFKSW